MERGEEDHTFDNGVKLQHDEQSISLMDWLFSAVEICHFRFLSQHIKRLLFGNLIDHNTITLVLHIQTHRVKIEQKLSAYFNNHFY